jgi:hypothetical protein
MGDGVGTSLENGTISDKERKLLTLKRAETKGNRLAGTTMDVNEAHRLFGHKSGATLQKIANALGMKLTGKFKPCSSCMLVTARRSKVNRVSMVKSETPGERLCVDTTGPFPPALSREQYVVVVVDEATGYSWSRFSTTKKEIAELVKSTINNVEQVGRTTVYLRCDNAGENVSYLSPVCRDKKIILERSPPDTPQYNGKVERKITTLWQGTKKNLTAAGFSLEMRQRLWVESWKYTEQLENLACNAVLWEGPHALRIVDKPIEFGRTGVMFKGKATKKSMLNNGIQVIMVGYGGDKHSSDTYMVYVPGTNRIVPTKNVVWNEWHGDQLYDAANMDEFEFPSRHACIREERSTTVSDWSDPEDIDKFFKSSPIAMYSDSSSSDDSSDEEPDENSNGSTAPSLHGDSEDDSDSQSNSSDSDASPPRSLINLDKPQVLERRLRSQQRAFEEEQKSADDADKPTVRVTGNDEIEVEMHEVFMMMLRKEAQLEVVMNAISSDPDTPKDWKDLWENHREVWSPPACEEIENFIRRDAWELYPRSKLAGRKPT